jgi:hypothetical protein
MQERMAAINLTVSYVGTDAYTKQRAMESGLAACPGRAGVRTGAAPPLPRRLCPDASARRWARLREPLRSKRALQRACVLLRLRIRRGPLPQALTVRARPAEQFCVALSADVDKRAYAAPSLFSFLRRAYGLQL